MKTLELFAGSRSFSKVAERLGHEVYTTDNQDFEKIDQVCDIFDFDLDKLPYIPDIIWSSPPCTSFSVASIGHHWNPDHTPKTEKAELVEAIASEAKLTKADAKRALDAFINATTKALKKNERVALVGFGSFGVAKRAARKGRNPQTGKEIKISAKKVVKFRPGNELANKIK